jgi:5-bromo-4-chloroindolyl phosphate hydrolysis protein
VRNHNGARNFKRAEEELQKSKLDRKARTREHRVQREQYSRFNNNAKERPSKLISQRNTFTTRKSFQDHLGIYIYVNLSRPILVRVGGS